MSFVETLQPRALWKHFDRILEIPRGSGDEGPLRDYVIELAERNGLEHAVDGAGNVVVRKPGANGGGNSETTVLQSHLDMVNEKNRDVDHDFSSDPIQPERDGDVLSARGTTLGADNGIGVAAMLALMEATDLRHPPLELLFTIDEESGLTGAAQLDPSLLTGRRLLNLDTEEEDAVTVGCAGGGDSHSTLPIEREATPENAVALAVELRGLRGGHSGIDISLQRGNAVRLLARLLEAAGRGSDLRLTDVRGGDKHNAIPREASAGVVVPQDEEGGFRDRLESAFADVQAAFDPADPDMKLSIETDDAPEHALTSTASWRTLHLLHALPHGVLAMSYDIPDLVETSNNVAAVRMEDDRVEVLTSTRSSVASELHAVRARIRGIGHLAGATVKEEEPYPGWKPDLESPILAVLKEAFAEVKGKDPVVEAVHAGLETGIIGEKVPGMDMVSFGPQIDFPHSPDEQVLIPSVERFYRVLTRTLEKLVG